MADFDRAYQKTMVVEGGYANDPEDAGGETYRGISRRFHPTWSGWAIIDAEKLAGLNGMEKRLAENRLLNIAVWQFYREMFWNRFNGDSIPLQSIAEELFDTAVNMDVTRAVEFLQEALNLLNRNEKNYPDIEVDGKIGPGTLSTLGVHLTLEKGNPKALLKVMNTLQGMHYVERMRKLPNQEKYCRGWLERT